MNDVVLSNAPPPPAPLSAADIRRFLDYALEQLKIRRNEVVTALIETARAHPTIDDDEVLGEIAENMRIANALTRTAEDRRKEQKEPFLTGGRAVDSWFREFAEPLEKATLPIQVAMNAYGDRKYAREQALAAQAKAAADAAAAIAQEQAAEALRKGRADAASIALDQVSATAQAADDADARVNATPAELTRTYGSMGAVASLRRSWSWEVTQIEKVPRRYLMINPDALKETAKARDASGKPVAVIPGIRWIPTTKMGVK